MIRPNPSPPPTTPTLLSDLGIEPNPDDSTVVAIAARYVVRPDPSDRHGVEVIRRADGKIILRHHPADETRFETTFAGVAGDRLVLLDEDTVDDDSMEAGSAKRPDIGYVIDLASGKQWAMASIPSAPPLSPYGAQGTVDADGTWYYSAQEHGGFANCVGELDLKSLRGHSVECAPGNGKIYYVNTGDQGATWDIFTQPDFGSCREAHGIRGNEIYVLGPADDCDIFDTGLLDGWSIWTDQSRSEIVPYIPLHAGSGATTVNLGSAAAMSLLICGGYAYWKSDYTTLPRIASGTLVRWRPGWSSPQIVLAPSAIQGSEIADENIFSAGCNDNILTVTVNRYYTSRETWTLQIFAVPPDVPAPS